MPQNPTALPPTGSPTVAGVSSADLMRLVVEGAADGSLQDLDFQQMTAQQMRELQDAMLDAGEALSDEEKRDVESGAPELPFFGGFDRPLGVRVQRGLQRGQQSGEFVALEGCIPTIKDAREQLYAKGAFGLR